MKFFKYVIEDRGVTPYSVAQKLSRKNDKYLNRDGSTNVRPLLYLMRDAHKASAREIIEVAEALGLSDMEIAYFLKKSARND